MTNDDEVCIPSLSSIFLAVYLDKIYDTRLLPRLYGPLFALLPLFSKIPGMLLLKPPRPTKHSGKTKLAHYIGFLFSQMLNAA